VRSARKLARLARQEATFVSLAGGGRPNDRTVARFRRETAAAFAAVFQETVILAFRLGLARRGHMALDGTTLKATTSKHTALSLRPGAPTRRSLPRRPGGPPVTVSATPPRATAGSARPTTGCT